MASQSHMHSDNDLGGDFPEASTTRVAGTKREFGDLDVDEEDIFGSKKANIKAEETAPRVATGMILSLRESLQSCKDTLATCQSELEAAKSEVQKWHSAFQKESIPSEPRAVINYLQNLKCSEESLREQLEKANKRELTIMVTMAKRDQEIVFLKSELEAAKSEVQKWQSAFQKESFIPPGLSVEPRVVINYIKNLKSSEESLREQLEKAKKKEIAIIATTAKREQEIGDLKGMNKNNDKAILNLTPTVTTTKATPRKTVWDSTTHNIFLELCLDEVRKGNKPRSHFNKAGWANLGKNLKDRTGKSYSKLQLKNHWDSMKRDWKLFDRLMSLMSVDSGLEWDPVRKTINATPEWWDEKVQAEPDLVKFKDRNMEMYQLYYDPLFRDSATIGDRTDPQLLIDNGPNDVQDENGIAGCLEGKENSDDVNLVDGDEEILLPESSSTKMKKSQNIAPICSNKEKPFMASSFEAKLDTLFQVFSSRSTQSYPLPSSIPSLSECMDLVSGLPDFEPGSKCYNKALRIFWKEEARESFMYPSSIEGKVAFLKSLME